jgi:hypothetical protein
MDVIEKPAVQETVKSVTRPTVAQIHESFFTEVEVLRDLANKPVPISTDKEDIIAKSNLLNSLGFTKAAETKQGEAEATRISQAKAENAAKAKLIRAIKYFQEWYPLHKFITEQSVKQLCRKYGLVYSTVDNYIGTVPDKNLQEIANFKLRKEDTLYKNIRRYRGIMSSPDISYGPKITEEEHSYSTTSTECFLEIAAPVKDFKLDRMVIENFQLKELPPENDPIVLQPVLFEGDKHYLILTAWGEEAADPLVVNPIQN